MIPVGMNRRIDVEWVCNADGTLKDFDLFRLSLTFNTRFALMVELPGYMQVVGVYVKCL